MKTRDGLSRPIPFIFSSLSMAPPRQRGLPDARQRGNYGLHTIIGAHIQFPCLQILLWPSSVLSNRVGSCLNPNSILHIIIFTHRCEAYLGTPFLPFVQISLLVPVTKQLPAHGDWRSWGTTLASPSIYIVCPLKMSYKFGIGDTCLNSHVSILSPNMNGWKTHYPSIWMSS
jgi:hypothetical protein